MIFELNKKYKLGKRTFWFIFLKHSKIPALILCALIGSAVALYVGETSTMADVFLATHFDGIVPKSLVFQWVILLIISVLIVLFVGMIEFFGQHRFLLDEHSFHIRKGIFMIREKVIPYRHIQNVDIEQPYHYRIFGVAKLNITTGAQGDSFGETKKNQPSQGNQDLIPIIDKKIAQNLAAFLIRKGGEKNT